MNQYTSYQSMQQAQQIKIQNKMDKDKGLIGFLQKKPLFQTETHKSARKKRPDTISPHDKHSIIQKITDRDLRGSLSKEKYNPAEQNIRNSNLSTQEIYIESDSRVNSSNIVPQVKSRFGQPHNSIPSSLNRSIQSLYGTKQSRLKSSLNRNFQTPANSKITLKDSTAIKSPNSMIKNLNKSKQQKQVNGLTEREKPIKFWQGAVTRTNGFQSARSESAQCLQTLSFKLKVELSNLNNKMERFRRDLYEYLHGQIDKLREKVFILVQQTFAQSAKYIAQFMKAEQRRVAGDLIKLRQDLEQYYIKIQNMKQEINKPQWRKVAGEILSTELENNIEGLISQSEGIDLSCWQKKYFGVQTIKNIAKQIRELIKLKE